MAKNLATNTELNLPLSSQQSTSGSIVDVSSQVSVSFDKNSDISNKGFGYALSQLYLQNKKPILYICDDEDELIKIKRQIRFVDPSIEIYQLLNYDCEVYSNIAPSKNVVAKRLQALLKITSYNGSEKFIVLATSRSILIKIPAEVCDYAKEQFVISQGQALSQASLRNYLKNQHYIRLQAATEPGSYSILGSIIDVYPVSTGQPVRIDFFDEAAVRILKYNPLDLRSSEELSKDQKVVFSQSHEIPLNAYGLKNFKSNFLKNFGFVAIKQNEIYQKVIAGQIVAGIEKYAPLFSSRKLCPFIDLIPSDFMLVTGNINKIKNEMSSGIKWIEDVYKTRLERSNLEIKTEKVVSTKSSELFDNDNLTYHRKQTLPCILEPSLLYSNKPIKVDNFIELSLIDKNKNEYLSKINVYPGYDFNIIRKQENFISRLERSSLVL